MVDRDAPEFLRKPAWPTDRGSNGAFRFSNAKEYFLRVLSNKPRPCLQILRLTEAARLECDRGSDGIAVARLTPQSERDRISGFLHHVVQDPQLRGITVFEDDLQPPVVVYIGQYKGAAVLGKVQSHRA